MISFQVERYQDCIEQMKLIYPDHWAELALDRNEIELAPDYARYDYMAESGVLHLVTARADEAELAGYFLFVITPGLHYSKSKQAFYDIFYLVKEHRVGWNGINFVKFAEESLKTIGVEKMYVGVKLNNDFGVVFDRLGFSPIERIYSKILR